MSETIKIRKINVKDTKPSLSYEKKDIGGSWFPVEGEKHSEPVHPDCVKALDNLKIHLAILADYVPASDVKDIKAPRPELVERVHVRGIAIGGTEDEPDVMILGHRITAMGKSVTLNSPFLELGVGDDQYKFIKDLNTRVGRVISEAVAYLDGSKRGVEAQQKLDMPDAPAPVAEEKGKKK